MSAPLLWTARQTRRLDPIPLEARIGQRPQGVQYLLFRNRLSNSIDVGVALVRQYSETSTVAPSRWLAGQEGVNFLGELSK